MKKNLNTQLTRLRQRFQQRSQRRSQQRTAFTLIELLVVIAIIALLSALLIPAVIGSQAALDRAKTLDLIQGLTMALKTEKVAGKGLPMPDHPVISGESPPAEGTPEERVGFFMYDPLDTTGKYLVNRFIDGQGFAFDYSGMVNEDKIVIDSWGEPLHYVLGDYKNRKEINGVDNPSYDETLPQDLNKPKTTDATEAAEDTDWAEWNPKDMGKYPYIYSVGPEQLQKSWIYYKE